MVHSEQEYYYLNVWIRDIKATVIVTLENLNKFMDEMRAVNGQETLELDAFSDYWSREAVVVSWTKHDIFSWTYTKADEETQGE